MTETVGAIDAWATLVPPGTIDRWPPEFISIFKRYGSLPLFERGMTTEEILDNMDAAGVDRLMLSAFGYGPYHIIRNEEVAEICAKHPDRFRGVAAVDLGTLERLGSEQHHLGVRALRGRPDQLGADLGELTEIDIQGVGRITFQYLTDPEGNIIELQKWS